MTSARNALYSPGYPMLTTRSSCPVLIVDDNTDLARSMSMLLSHYGFPVATASDGRSAIETARSFRPKIVLLDIGLPDIDGYRVAQALRNDVGLNDSTLIAISANDPLSRSTHSPVSYFDHYLVKPVDLDILLLLFPKTSDDDY
jgi:DNA-binding response OmpR family regulator